MNTNKQRYRTRQTNHVGASELPGKKKEEKMRVQIIKLMGILLLGLQAAGCMTSTISNKERVDVLLRPKTETVPSRVNKSSVNEVINYIVALEETGELEDAQQLSESAMRDFRSEDGSLERDFARAYIVLSFKAGNIDAVKRGFGLLSRYPRNVYRHEKLQDEVDRINKIVFQTTAL